MARGIAHDPEVKGAVMAALLAGAGITQLAEQYHIPESTIKHWKRENDGLAGELDEPVKKEIGELLLGYIKASLKTLTKQVEFFSDEKWLSKQHASEVAVLHGVSADKVIRLLEALADDGQGGNEEPPAPGTGDGGQ